MAGRLLSLAYRLRRNRLGGWTLERWGVTLAWGSALIIVVQWCLRGHPALPVWHWLLALFIAGGAALCVLGAWAARRLLAAFTPEPGLLHPAPATLTPKDKILLRATGHFELAGRSRILADLMAYWRTYASRDHVILAIEHRSRFLLGQSPEDDFGMWYIFIPAEAVEEVRPGRLSFGATTGPALCVVYRRTEAWQGAKKGPRRGYAMVYLQFANELARAAVWSDLDS